MENKDLITLSISALSLFVAFFSLGWNIIRDLILDKNKLNFEVKFGGITNIKTNSQKGLFIPKESLTDGKKAPEDTILFNIVNLGRRQIMVIGIGAEIPWFKKKKKDEHAYIVCDSVPKMIQPYEIFSVYNKNIDSILKSVRNGHIKRFFVKDSKGKIWKNSRKNMEKFIKDIKE
jgi:hypothetical protein